jgi:hypothetical protein
MAPLVAACRLPPRAAAPSLRRTPHAAAACCLRPAPPCRRPQLLRRPPPLRPATRAQASGDARVPQSAPSPGAAPSPPPPALPPPPPPGAPADAGRAYRTVLRALSNLPLALGEMATLAALSAVGTVIEQNKARIGTAQRPGGRLRAQGATAAASLLARVRRGAARCGCGWVSPTQR